MLSPAETEALVEAARSVRSRAYAPYSRYQVAAALRARDGRIFTGVNVENSAYPTSMCAERNALGTAVGAGAQDFTAVAIVTERGKDGQPGSPCGACRQALSELSVASELEVVLAAPDGSDFVHTTLAALLPRAFSHESL